NGDFTKSAFTRRDELRREGYDVRLWNGKFLQELLAKSPGYSRERRSQREYQLKIINSSINKYHAGSKKLLFIVATGLGKTVIASSIADNLFKEGLHKILV